MTTNFETEIKRAAHLIQAADGLVFCAGAGMGVDSGLPDFRGDKGFWKAYPPYAKIGLGFMDMANPRWFEGDLAMAWGFYGHRLKLYRETVPHHGFDILLEWGKAKAGGYFVFTSNVDDQFQKAGFEEEKIEECHGSIHYLQCVASCGKGIWSAAEVRVHVDEETMRARAPLPKCPSCGASARPNVLMFGDWHWDSARTGLQGRRFQEWLHDNQRRKIVVIECGAGTAVPTVRLTSEQICRELGASLVRINVRDPHVSYGHIGLPLGALEALSRINALI